MNTNELRKAAKCVFIACEEPVAKDLSDKLLWAANTIDQFQQPLTQVVAMSAKGGPCCQFYEVNGHGTCGKCGADLRCTCTEPREFYGNGITIICKECDQPV